MTGSQSESRCRYFKTQNSKCKCYVVFASCILHFALQRKEIEDPAEHDAAEDKRAKELRAESQLLLRIVPHERAEDDGDVQREEDHQSEVGSLHLRARGLIDRKSTRLNS